MTATGRHRRSSRLPGDFPSDAIPKPKQSPTHSASVGIDGQSRVTTRPSRTRTAALPGRIGQARVHHRGRGTDHAARPTRPTGGRSGAPQLAVLIRGLAGQALDIDSGRDTRPAPEVLRGRLWRSARDGLSVPVRRSRRRHTGTDMAGSWPAWSTASDRGCDPPATTSSSATPSDGYARPMAAPSGNVPRSPSASGSATWSSNWHGRYEIPPTTSFGSARPGIRPLWRAPSVSPAPTATAEPTATVWCPTASQCCWKGNNGERVRARCQSHP